MEKFGKDIDEYFELTRENSVKETVDLSNKLIKEITTSDPIFIAIIKGHLLIENILIDILKEYGIKDKAIEGKYFMDKLNLCYGLDLIREEVRNPLAKINKMRNKYGHDISFKFTNKYLNEMISSLSAHDKGEYEKQVNEEFDKLYDEDDKLYIGLVQYIEYICMKLKRQELLMDYKKANKALEWHTAVIKKTNKYLKKELDIKV